MLTLDEARARLFSDLVRVGHERVALACAAGRVLARALVASEPHPRVATSAMDGYAFAADDLVGEPPLSLPVRGESRPGSAATTLARGTACRVFTGAELPIGADGVVMQEHVVREGDAILFSALPRARAHVRSAGADLAAGDVAIEAGTRLSARHLALAASLDVVELEVARRPVVAIVATGDELRPGGSTPRPSSVPESNAAALAAMVAAAGGVARIAPIARDDLELASHAFADALDAADLLVTVGGVSVGEHDVVRPALERVGVALDFWKVAIKPGKAIAVGRRGRARVVGLPGNAASALVTFALFGVPLLRAMQGDRRPVASTLPARLASPVKHAPGRLELLRVTLDVVDGELVAESLANQSSSATTGMAWADALALIPSESAELAAGARVEVLRLVDVGA